MPTVLGLSAFYHDSAAALIQDGRIVAAASEERFSRKKGDPSFPRRAVEYCLREAGIAIDGVSCVGFYEKPLLKFERILETSLSVAPRGFRSFARAAPLWASEKLYQDRRLRAALGWEGEVCYAEHHESHAASAFFPSPFSEAAILTVDGVGEWATASIGAGCGEDIQILAELRWPDSLGLLYSAFAVYLGFKVNSGEQKVMGLAPFGEPAYVDVIFRHLVHLAEDGSFRLNQRYFDYISGMRMTNAAFDELLGGRPRTPESEFSQRHLDVARSVQEVCEHVMLRMARFAHCETGLEDLCLAGGVALNCVANSRIQREGPFKRVWVQPAAGDAGGALGVAELVWHRRFKGRREVPAAGDSMRGALLGPGFSDEEIEEFLRSVGADYQRMPRADLLSLVARHLANQKVVGWFNGRMEYGPRALGARSILADPRSPSMRTRLNRVVKRREEFRPFGPSALAEHAGDHFELSTDSPYMLFAVPVRAAHRVRLREDESGKRGLSRLDSSGSDLPAVTHVDLTARVQTVSRETNPDFYDLIAVFERLTGCPCVLNTSFNVRGEPIVATPMDAYSCCLGTTIDFLVLGSFLVNVLPGRVRQEVRSDGRTKTASPGAPEGRRFGLELGLALGGLSAVAVWQGKAHIGMGLTALALLCLLAGLAAPALLAPLYRAWMGLSRAVSQATSPVFIGAVYFALLTPIGVVLRALGKDPLRRAASESSSWVRRLPGRQRSDLARQF